MIWLMDYHPLLKLIALINGVQFKSIVQIFVNGWDIATESTYEGVSKVSCIHHIPFCVCLIILSKLLLLL